MSFDPGPVVSGPRRPSHIAPPSAAGAPMGARSDLAGARVGLVLGGGGTAGLAFHAGTLLALQHDLAWDPRTAEVIVGTSAGSIVAALLRAGVTTDDLAAWGTAAPPLPDRVDVRRSLERMDAGAGQSVPARRRRPHRSRLTAMPRRGTPLHTTLMTLLPPGTIDVSSALVELETLIDAWPERALYVTAVRTSDARRIVFGRDHQAGIGAAVAASCAVPGLFAPVKIGRHTYIDGGAHSPTNAELLIDAAIDRVLVLSPMTARTAGATWGRLDAPMRHVARRQLRREVAALQRVGLPVDVFEPSIETLKAMGSNPLDRTRTTSIITASFLTAGTDRLQRHHAPSAQPDDALTHWSIPVDRVADARCDIYRA